LAVVPQKKLVVGEGKQEQEVEAKVVSRVQGNVRLALRQPDEGA
jgi:hypothetical protein